MKSQTAHEALLTHLGFLLAGKENPEPEVEILDAQVMSYGQWRLIVWYKFDEGMIRTAVVHQSSIVEVWPDGPVPPCPQD